MTDRELMQQALEALETVFMPHHPAVIALRERLAREEDGDCQHCGGKGCVACDARQEPTCEYCGGDRFVEPARKEQEPVAWRTFDGEGGYDYRSYEGNEDYIYQYVKRNGGKYANWVDPLYTTPQPCPNCASLEAQNTELDRRLAEREWVGLTEEEIEEINVSLTGRRDLSRMFARAIEAKLKEKNA